MGGPALSLSSSPGDIRDEVDARHTSANRPSRWVVVSLVAAFLALAVAAVLAIVPLPYAVMSPGPVTDTLGSLGDQKIIDVAGEGQHPEKGKLFFTTVRVQGGPGTRVTAYDLLGAALDDSRDVYPQDEIFPPSSTRESVQQENAAEMEGSQQTAAAVAERALGHDVPVSVLVAQVLKGSPSDGLIEADDVLVSVDGTPASSPEAVRTAVRAHKPGDEVSVTVRRAGSEVTVAPRAADTRGVATIGVVMSGRYQLPIPVTIHAGAVGGPSAGLMFSLGIYDVLTDGNLTGGASIAGTGTIADDGAVGPIGGIRQKVVGARGAGAAWFLTPADNCADLKGHVPAGLHLVKVATFSDAKQAVESIAAGSTDTLSSCGF